MNSTVLSLFIITILFFHSNVNGFKTKSFSSLSIKKIHNKTKLNLFSNSLLTAAAEVVDKPDGYVYGAVAAPDWVLPVASVFIILSAAIPFLLKPGEEALEQQRKDEEFKGQKFGNRKKGGDV